MKIRNLITCAAVFVSSIVFAKPTTVLVSIDGFANFYLEKYELSFISQLARNGVTAEAMLPVYPSKTFPNHVSIVTGVYPSKHGIVHNSFFHPKIGQNYRLGAGKKDKRWLTAKPIWTHIEEQGKTAYLYFWPESESISYAQQASHAEKFQHDRPNSTRVETVLSWICEQQAKKPDFISLYFNSVDDAGHHYGQDSPELIAALSDIDKQLKFLVTESEKCQKDNVNFLVVSDHGMTKVKQNSVMYVEDILKPDSVKIVNGQTQLFIYEKDPKKLNDVRSHFLAYNNALSKKQFNVYDKSQFPEHWRIDSNSVVVPDLIVDAKAPYIFGKKGRKNSVETHGFDAKYNEDLHALFIGYGPSFKPGSRLPQFENVHIVALIAHLVGVSLPATVDGKLGVFKPALK